MSHPLIMIVDDRPRGLHAMVDAVVRRYGADYHVVGRGSAAAALDELTRAHGEGEDVAMVIADQWMPEMPGRELLERAHELAREAQRALLAGWGDKRASGEILKGCALGPHRIVTLDSGRELVARSVIIATGAEYRRSGVPRIDRFQGMGVLYVVGYDIATALKGHDVVVHGGGNSAGQAVVFLARSAHRVIHVVRGSELSKNMSAYLIADIGRLANVELRLDTEIIDADGAHGLERVTLRHKSGHTEELATPTVFMMIGAHPHTEWLAGLLERDRDGFIVTGGPDRLLLETSMRGVFAAGDVRAGSIKRIASAVGEASVAVQVVHQYLDELSHPTLRH